MAKYFLLSFDDGTIYDERFITLLNRYDIKCTFNLNSGLEDFVWEYEGKPVQRLKLKEKQHIFAGHEIASHSAHHCWLDSLDDDTLRREIISDCRALTDIFGKRELGFGVPFTACGEREIHIIRQYVRYIRLSEFREDFTLPADPYHIYINGLYNDPDIREKILRFSQNSLPDSLFVLCGHSYEFEMLDHWRYIEDLLAYIRSFPDFKIMTTMEFVNTVWK